MAPRSFLAVLLCLCISVLSVVSKSHSIPLTAPALLQDAGGPGTALSIVARDRARFGRARGLKGANSRIKFAAAKNTVQAKNTMWAAAVPLRPCRSDSRLLGSTILHQFALETRTMFFCWTPARATVGFARATRRLLHQRGRAILLMPLMVCRSRKFEG